MIKEHELDAALVARFEELARDYMAKLGVVDWDVGFTTMKDDSGDMACVEYMYSARAARIAIDTGFDADEDDVRVSALHEVLHLLFADLREAVEPYLPKDDEALTRRLSSLEHSVINRIIRAWNER